MKTRNFSQIVYPDSLPKDWLAFLANLHIPLAISPLHSPDKDEEGGRKKHYHILYHFDGPKTIDNVNELVDYLHGTTVIPVNSINAYTRYLTHRDDPLKEQFTELPVLMGGFDYELYIENNLSKKLRYQYISEMIEFCKETNISEFYVLFEYAMINRPDTWFPSLCDNSAFIMGEYLKSVRYSSRVK